MHPHIFVTAGKIDGLRSVEEVRRGLREDHLCSLWETLVALAYADTRRPPHTLSTTLPGRPQLDVDHQNRDWTLVNALAQRIQRCALAYLLTERVEYRDDALRQMEALFDPAVFPDWRDKAHPKTRVDLRGGQLSQAIALAYDWMHPLLSTANREAIVEGLDRCDLQLYLDDVAENAYWLDVRTNWLTVVVGGHGIAGMALGDDYPRSQELIDAADPRMVDYLSKFGLEGEFSESVGYASSTIQPVAYFAAQRYASGGGVDRLTGHPFPETCRWICYFTLPSGRYAAFGDGDVDAPPALSYFPAVADATRDGHLQQFYLDYADIDVARRSLVYELLWYDPALEPIPLDGKVPTGRAFAEHDAGFSSRTCWGSRHPPSIVYGKGGTGTIVHGHHDVGQVCVDGYGDRLIVDLGSPPGYPGDYGANKYEYYNASAIGHNVLVIGGREMKHESSVEAVVFKTEFDDSWGGVWQIDLASKYDGARMVRRTVVHLLPATAFVLDEVQLETVETLSLRWHTASDTNPAGDGSFLVEESNAILSARVVSLLDGENTLSIASRRHAYQAPYNRHRLSDVFPQRHEPYIEATTHATRACLLSLFTIVRAGETHPTWVDTNEGWSASTREGPVAVRATERELNFRSPRTDVTIDLTEPI